MKEMERDQDKAGMDGAAFASAKAEVCRLTSDIYGVNEMYEGNKADRKDAVDR